MSESQPESSELDVLVVGAGFSGVYMLHRLRQLGLSARVLERGDGVGGVWFWNRYPGARCDVQSFDYCYSFDEDLQQEWRWTERYAAQPEILSYIEHVVERFDLLRDIQLETTVVSADFDEGTDRWHVRTDDDHTFVARFVVMATGVLSASKRPDFPGLEDFEGDWYLTSSWPKEGVDLSGRRVGLIGTGSTGIQITPRLAEQADHLYVFQRTPNFSMPARNHPLDDDFYRELRAGYQQRRTAARQTARGYPSPPVLADRPALEHSAQERQEVYERVWANGGPTFTSSFPDLILDKAANDTAADFVRSKIREIVRDPATAELLSPHDHPLGTRRPCVDTDYYPVFNRDDVTLVDVRRAAIERIEPRGLRTTEESYELDTIVFAIGFDAMTGALMRIDIKGAGGAPLRDAWEDGPHSYLGLAAAGFPNLFMITGPGSPSVLTNMVMSIEQHVEWISELLRHAEVNGVRRIEARLDAQEAWGAHVVEAADKTLLPLANSWWTGANIPGKPRVFMPYVAGFAVYGKKLQEVVDRGYDGFDLIPAELRTDRRDTERRTSMYDGPVTDAFLHTPWLGGEDPDHPRGDTVDWRGDPRLQRVMSTFDHVDADGEPVGRVGTQDLLAQMDEAGVRSGILPAKVYYRSSEEGVRAVHLALAEVAAGSDGRLLCVGTIVPPELGPGTYWDVMQTTRMLEETHRELGFVGTHLTPAPWGMAPHHKWFYPLYAKLVELGMTLFVHVGMPGPLWPMQPHDPAHLDEVALAFPELRIIAHHIGDPWTDMSVRLAAKHPHVYICTSAWSPKRYPEPLMAFLRGRWHGTAGSDKVLYASDHPLLDMQRATADARAMELPDGKLAAVLHDNAQRLFWSE